jgi:hypothetical protein
VTISNSRTPKLKASDLTEYCPRIAYSGAMYPLRINSSGKCSTL